MISDKRNRLSGSTIEALQLQKNWLKKGVVKSHITDLANQVAGLTKTSIFRLSDSDVISFFSSSPNVTPDQ